MTPSKEAAPIEERTRNILGVPVEAMMVRPVSTRRN